MVIDEFIIDIVPVEQLPQPASLIIPGLNVPHNEVWGTRIMISI